jgi:hypothetical protein
MTTWNRNQLRPMYPVFKEHQLPFQPQTWPPDMRPSGLGPGQAVYASTFGRNLAGVGADMAEPRFDSVNAEGIETYPNELDLLAQGDDVVGNGVFDPNDTHGNIHPDAGVFNDHQSLPGYVARDKFYAPSEVRDLTQPNDQVVYVPGGAVSLQQGQQETLTKNQLLWQLPRDFNPMTMEDIPQYSTVDAPTAATPVGQVQTATESPNYKMYYIFAGVGMAAGLAWVLLSKKKKGKRR